MNICKNKENKELTNHIVGIIGLSSVKSARLSKNKRSPKGSTSQKTPSSPIDEDSFADTPDGPVDAENRSSTQEIEQEETHKKRVNTCLSSPEAQEISSRTGKATTVEAITYTYGTNKESDKQLADDLRKKLKEKHDNIHA